MEKTKVSRDLTASPLHRQNILNNVFAVQEIKKNLGISGISFERKFVLTKEMVASFYQADIRTIERIIENSNNELRQNGYDVLRGERLNILKAEIQKTFGTDVNVGTKTTVLGVFTFRAFLDVGMMLVDSERARQLRQMILDIVIDVINQRSGGNTKYINRRDEDFIASLFQEENYRKEFTDALKECVEMNNYKYAFFTNLIYESIFCEKAKEYREILKLQQRDRVRDTFYSEILDLVSSYEAGFADVLRRRCKKLGRKLNYMETTDAFKEFESAPHWKPLLAGARTKMASRNLAFRDAFHQKLESYIADVGEDDFERFLGEQAKDYEERLEEAKETMRRLKDR